MAGFLHKKSYINIGLIYNITTHLTCGTGTGLGRVPQTRPVPVPGYPCGFTNCYALPATHTFTIQALPLSFCMSSHPPPSQMDRNLQEWTGIQWNGQKSAGMDRNFGYIFVLICSIFISYEFLQILIYLIVNNIQLFLYILTKKRMKIKGKSNGERNGRQ